MKVSLVVLSLLVLAACNNKKDEPVAKSVSAVTEQNGGNGGNGGNANIAGNIGEGQEEVSLSSIISSAEKSLQEKHGIAYVQIPQIVIPDIFGLGGSSFAFEFMHSTKSDINKEEALKDLADYSALLNQAHTEATLSNDVDLLASILKKMDQTQRYIDTLMQPEVKEEEKAVVTEEKKEEEKSAVAEEKKEEEKSAVAEEKKEEEKKEEEKKDEENKEEKSEEEKKDGQEDGAIGPQ